jgi:hypothetical protein
VGFLVTRGRLGFFLCRLGEEVHLKIAPAGSVGRVVRVRQGKARNRSRCSGGMCCVWLAQSLHPDPDLNCSIAKRRVWSGLVFFAMCQDGREGKGMEKTRRSSSCNAKRT